MPHDTSKSDGVMHCSAASEETFWCGTFVMMFSDSGSLLGQLLLGYPYNYFKCFLHLFNMHRHFVCAT